MQNIYRKLFNRYDAIIKSLEHLKHKLYNDAQKFATVCVVKRQTKSPLPLPLASSSTTQSGRRAKRHHYVPSPLATATGTAPNATAKPCNLADASGSDVERTTAEPNCADTVAVSDHVVGYKPAIPRASDRGVGAKPARSGLHCDSLSLDDNLIDCRQATHLTYRAQPTSSRHVRLCKYRSDSLAAQLQPVVVSLCNGAVQKAVSQLLSHRNAAFDTAAIRAVCDIVWHEGKTLATSSKCSGSLHVRKRCD